MWSQVMNRLLWITVATFVIASYSVMIKLLFDPTNRVDVLKYLPDIRTAGTEALLWIVFALLAMILIVNALAGMAVRVFVGRRPNYPPTELATWSVEPRSFYQLLWPSRRSETTQ